MVKLTHTFRCTEEPHRALGRLYVCVSGTSIQNAPFDSVSHRTQEGLVGFKGYFFLSCLRKFHIVMLMVSCECSYWAGLSQSVKPGQRALPRASTCRGFPSILWAQTNPLQLTHGHISKHCFMDGLGCGNRSSGERECIQTREQKKVDAECSQGGREVCVCTGDIHIHV